MDIVTLLEGLVNALIEAEEKFLNDPKDFYSLEKSVKATTELFSAGFLGAVLSSVNEQICNSIWRQGRYIIQRTDKRTLITSVGDVTFDCTYFKRRSPKSGYTYLLGDLISLDKHERFREEAEVLLLTEALKTSYQEATRILPSKQQITKTTVMNKVHQIAEEVPYEGIENRKKPSIFLLKQMKIMWQSNTEKVQKTIRAFSQSLFMYMNGSRMCLVVRTEKN